VIIVFLFWLCWVWIILVLCRVVMVLCKVVWFMLRVLVSFCLGGSCWLMMKMLSCMLVVSCLIVVLNVLLLCMGCSIVCGSWCVDGLVFLVMVFFWLFMC